MTSRRQQKRRDALVREVTELVIASINPFIPDRVRPARDLAGEIAAYLGTRPGAATEQIRIGVRAASGDVRRVLEEDSRFTRVPCPRGTSAKAKCWTLAWNAGGTDS